MIDNFKLIDIYSALILTFILLFSGYSLWRCLSDPSIYLNRLNAIKAMINGFIFSCCFLGIWSYYWFVYKYLAAPYYYNYYVLAIGSALVIIGALSLFSSWILKNRIFKVCVFCLIMCGFITNITIFLSHRFAIENSLTEVQRFAKQINSFSEGNRNKYEYIVILGLPPETGLARNIAAYNTALMSYLKAQDKNWSTIKNINNYVKIGENNTSVVSPGGVLINASNVLLLSYIKESRTVTQLNIADIINNKIRKTEDSDPYSISFAGRELFYSVEAENFKFRRMPPQSI